MDSNTNTTTYHWLYKNGTQRTYYITLDEMAADLKVTRACIYKRMKNPKWDHIIVHKDFILTDDKIPFIQTEPQYWFEIRKEIVTLVEECKKNITRLELLLKNN